MTVQNSKIVVDIRCLNLNNGSEEYVLNYHNWEFLFAWSLNFWMEWKVHTIDFTNILTSKKNRMHTPDERE